MNQIKGAILQDSTRPIRRLFNDAVHRQPAIDSDEDDFLPEFHIQFVAAWPEKDNSFIQQYHVVFGTLKYEDSGRRIGRVRNWYAIKIVAGV